MPLINYYTLLRIWILHIFNGCLRISALSLIKPNLRRYFSCLKDYSMKVSFPQQVPVMLEFYWSSWLLIAKWSIHKELCWSTSSIFSILSTYEGKWWSTILAISTKLTIPSHLNSMNIFKKSGHVTLEISRAWLETGTKCGRVKSA